MRGFIVLGLTMLVAACATPWSTSGPASRGGGTYKIGAPYRVGGVLYTPREQPSYDETGVASWYGPGFHGRRTANGEVYNQNALSAAHATLPLPANVRVTNLENGRSLVVRVNDRGPFHDGRIIDLSARGADLLGFKGAGTARVRVQYLGPTGVPVFAIAKAAPPPAAPTLAPDRPVPVQEEPALIAMAPISNPPGEAPGVEPAAELRWVAGAQPAAAPKPASKSTMKRAQQIAAAAAALLVSSAEAAPAQEPATDTPSATASASRYFVQVATFADSGNAQALYNELAPLGRAAIVAPEGGERTLYRVRIGPIATREEASGILQDLIARGLKGAQIVSE
jgi:rare lipoprotein A